MYGLARPFLFGLDAERAHGIGLASLEAAYRSGSSPLLARQPKPLPTRALGMTFRNPVGLAAGLAKNGAHIDSLLALGFGFVEVGNVTPEPRAGNLNTLILRLYRTLAITQRLDINNPRTHHHRPQ